MPPQKKPKNTRSGKRTGQGASPRSEPLQIPWPEQKPDLAEAVALVEQHADRPFTLAEAVKAIKKHACLRNRHPEAHIRSLLSEAGNLARIPSEERYIPTRLVFRNAAFYIAPTEAELSQGILVPGHRFYPFMSDNVAPGAASLFDEDDVPLPKKTITGSLKELIIYHSLLGIGGLLQICTPVDDHPIGDLEFQVEIEVFDLSAFYQRYAVTERGLLSARVLDHTNGVFQLSYTDTEARFAAQKEIREQDQRLEHYLTELMPVLGPEPPLTLLRDAYAHLFQDGEDLSKPASPFGPLLAQSKQVKLAAYHERPCLIPPDVDPMAFYGLFGMLDNDGRCETLEDLFHKGDLSIELSYVRAAMLDELDTGTGDRKAVVDRIMGGRSVPLWEEEDWAFFQEDMAILWEEVKSQRKALSSGREVRKLRSRILEQCDRHLAMMRHMDRLMMMPEDLPMEAMSELAMLDNLYHRMLEILEMAPDRKTLKAMEGQVDAMKERGEGLRATLEQAVEEDSEEDDWETDIWDDAGDGGVENMEGPVTSYVVKVKFRHEKRIWRKIEIAQQQTLHDLHLMIQTAINWDNDHLYSFFMSNRPWDSESEIASPYGEEEPRADQMRIQDLNLTPGQKFLYLFDYGDNHEFEIEVLEVRTDAPAGEYPKLLDSRGDAPEQYGEWV